MGTYLGQRVGAGVAVIQNRQVLLIQRRDNGLWDIPGGAVEPGERVEDAARRELSEEAGLIATSLSADVFRLLGVFSGPNHRHTYPDGNMVDWVTVVYVTSQTTGTLRAGDDAAQAQWWPISALPVSVGAATEEYFASLSNLVNL